VTKPPYVIAISGASCSGKTTLADALRREFDDALVFGLDSYYRDFSGISHLDINVDVPEAIHNDLAASHIRQLRARNSIEMPIYDYATHSRSTKTRHIEPAQYIIVEGLFALYWEDIRALTDLAVFIDADPDVCRTRRIDRDTRERGRDAGAVGAEHEDHRWNQHQRDRELHDRRDQHAKPKPLIDQTSSHRSKDNTNAQAESD